MTASDNTSSCSGELPTLVGLTMSTLEIAGLASKRHADVLRDARKMLQTLDIPERNFAFSYRGEDGKDHPILNLPKRETLILVSGYSTEMRARIIDRWMQLEAAVAQPAEMDELSADARRVIGGIIKKVVHNELATVLPTMVEAAIVADPRRAVMDVVSVRQLLDDAKAIQKGRNGLNRRVGFELRERALTCQPPITLRRCPNSMVWLFPRAFAESYMLERGLRLVREHNDRARGQGVLTLVGKAS